MKYVRKVLNRHGQTYLYFRRRGHPNDGQPLYSPIPDVWEGSALQREVMALANQEPYVVAALPGTLGAALRKYELEDPRFRVLEASTKSEYLRYIAEFNDDLGEVRIGAFTPAFVLSLQNSWAIRGHRAAALRMNVLKNVLSPVLVAKNLPDPFARLPAVPHPRRVEDPHPAWPDAVFETVMSTCIERKKFGIARAVAIGRYIGARRGDLVKITSDARRDGRFVFRSGKKLVPVDVPEPEELTEWLDVKTPAAQPLSRWQAKYDRQRGVIRLPATTLVYNTRGQRYSEDGLGQELGQIIAELHAAGKVDKPDYDLHGLRHTVGVEAALAGVTDAQGAALLGHGSPHSFAIYRRQAGRMLMANDGAELVKAARRKSRSGTAGEQEVTTLVQPGDNPSAAIHRLARKKP